MNLDDLQELNKLLEQIRSMKVHASGRLGAALKKPLNGVATGIDAAHVHWHSLHGPDNVENGIALCKLHHWAFDKGILGINDDARICIASVFSAQQDGGLPLESLANRSLAVQPRKEIAKRFLDWHRNNVYLGTETAKTA